MAVFWSLMFVFSLGCLLTGLIRPSVYSTLFHTNFTRKRAGLIFGSLFVVVLILGTIFPARKAEEGSNASAMETTAHMTAAAASGEETTTGSSPQGVEACKLLSRTEVESVLAEAFAEPTEITSEFTPAKTCVYESVAKDAVGDPKTRITLQYYTEGTFTNRPADKQQATKTKIGDDSYFSESGILFLNKGGTLINMLGNITYQQEEELGKLAFQHMP
ncbi:MAG: hypothetical protein ACYDET_07050 [Thermoleophilia bacterium]